MDIDIEKNFDPWATFDTDAMHWAQAFDANWHGLTVDIDTLLGWFANAIEIGRAAGFAQATQLSRKMNNEY